jgi:hypothetical protein
MAQQHKQILYYGVVHQQIQALWRSFACDCVYSLILRHSKACIRYSQNSAFLQVEFEVAHALATVSIYLRAGVQEHRVQPVCGSSAPYCLPGSNSQPAPCCCCSTEHCMPDLTFMRPCELSMSTTSG